MLLEKHSVSTCTTTVWWEIASPDLMLNCVWHQGLCTGQVNAFDGEDSVCVKGIWIKGKMLVKCDFAVLKRVGSTRRKLSNCASPYNKNNTSGRRINTEVLGNDCSAKAICLTIPTGKEEIQRLLQIVYYGGKFVLNLAV